MQSKGPMKEFVVNLLSKHLPEFYYYHNVGHTLYVAAIANEIGVQEKCTLKELDLLAAAALWHDTGYINAYKGHEEESCRLARTYLPEYGYSWDDIEIITGIIMATQIPQSPKNKLEEIMADADLTYLGTEEATLIANDFYRELKHLNPSLTPDEWNSMQISFLQHHRYFTQYCKERREPMKLKYVAKLLDNK